MTLPDALAEMLAELASHQLCVVLVPAPDPRHEGHCVRARADQNPRWYRAFCAAHLASRLRRNPRPDTLIKRANTLAVLERLAAGRESRSKYAAELLAIAERRAAGRAAA